MNIHISIQNLTNQFDLDEEDLPSERFFKKYGYVTEKVLSNDRIRCMVVPQVGRSPPPPLPNNWVCAEIYARSIGCNQSTQHPPTMGRGRMLKKLSSKLEAHRPLSILESWPCADDYARRNGLVRKHLSK